MLLERLCTLGKQSVLTQLMDNCQIRLIFVSRLALFRGSLPFLGHVIILVLLNRCTRDLGLFLLAVMSFSCQLAM